MKKQQAILGGRHDLSNKALHPSHHVGLSRDILCVHTKAMINIGDNLVTTKGTFVANNSPNISGNRRPSQYYPGYGFYEFSITPKK